MGIKKSTLDLFSTALDKAVEEKLVEVYEDRSFHGDDLLTTSITPEGEVLMELKNVDQTVTIGTDSDFATDSEVIQITLVLLAPDSEGSDKGQVEATFTRELHVNSFASFDDTCAHIAGRLAPVIVDFLVYSRLPGPFDIAYDRYR